MRRLGRVALLALFSLGFWNCDSGATGVDACREIETKKCELLVGCPNVALANANDVDACKLFYRDQCLHGMADGASPDAATLTACLGALDLAGACKTATLATCADAPPLAMGRDSAMLTGCDAMLATESLAACSFLAPATGAGGATASSSTASASTASSVTTGGGGSGGAG